MDDNQRNYSVSVPITWMIGFIFIGLKLLGFIQWGWFWVRSPFWIPLAIFFSVIGIVLAIMGICGIMLLAAVLLGSIIEAFGRR